MLHSNAFGDLEVTIDDSNGKPYFNGVHICRILLTVSKDALEATRILEFLRIISKDPDEAVQEFLIAKDHSSDLQETLSTRYDYDTIKIAFERVSNKQTKQKLLEWLKHIKKNLQVNPKNKEQTTTSAKKKQDDYAVTSSNSCYDRLYRISAIGKMHDISGAKLNMVLQLEDILLKTKDGYELAADYKHLGRTIFVDIKNEYGETYKKKNYVVYTEEGKELIEKLIEKYFDIE